MGLASSRFASIIDVRGAARALAKRLGIFMGGNLKQIQQWRQVVSHLTVEQRKAVANYMTEDGITLLCSAVERRDLAILTFLLDDCYADINHHSDGYQQMTPLFLAVLKADEEIVRILAEHGADINAPNAYHSTPVLAACGKTFQIVRYLVESGADINMANYIGETCLMRSAELTPSACQLLVEHGASVNAVDSFGNTALHYAVSSPRQNQTVVKLLLECGADTSIRNQFDNDVLQTAAMYGSTDDLDYLISRLKPSADRQADLYSLIAATKLEHEDVVGAMSLWKRSLSIRTRSSQDIGVTEPNAVYRGAAEAQDVLSLEAIENNRDALYMQALVARERILGRRHIETVYWLAERAFSYAELPNGFQRGIELYKYALASCGDDVISSEPFVSAQPHILLYELLWRKFEEDANSVRFEDTADVMRMVIKACRCAPRTCRRLSDFKETVLRLSIHVLHLLCRLTSSEPESRSLKRLAGELVWTKCTTLHGETLLHVAVDQASAYLNSHYYPHVPSSDVVEQLLDVGADVDAQHIGGCTPLLTAVSEEGPTDTSRRDDWLRTVDLLLRHGSHVDVPNVYGDVAVDLLPASVDRSRCMRLECLAARAVRRHDVEYDGILSPSLVQFVDIH